MCKEIVLCQSCTYCIIARVQVLGRGVIMTTHHFQPTRFSTILGSVEPVLRIKSGDTVITTTLDADGWDENCIPTTAPSNPMTGPFFVEGAEPGDTLVVHLDRLLPNRSLGWSRAIATEYTVEPAFFAKLPQDKIVDWHIDFEANQIRLQDPTPISPNINVPLNPMLGCFGVAPAGGESISTTTAANHGGNMDYRRFTSGTTAFFPVFVSGGLFFLGDGHANQGDGEIAGSGIEVSLDVQFTVNIRKNSRIYWPRGEDSQYIFTVGNCRPLEQAIQHATTEMLRWLTCDFGFDLFSANVLMGQIVLYDIASVFNPSYSVACIIDKKYLS